MNCPDDTVLRLEASIRDVERQAFDAGLRHLDFLIARVPAGDVRDQLVARRERLVNDFTTALLAQPVAA